MEDKKLPGMIHLVKNTATAQLRQISIPQVAAKKELLKSISNDTWWQNATIGQLESLHEEIRALVKFLEKDKQAIIYTNLEDELTGDIVVEDIIGTYTGLAEYRERVSSFIRKHSNYIAIHKIRSNEPISLQELDQVKQLLFSEDPDAAGHLDEVLSGKDFAQFIRSIVGLEAAAAKALFAGFINRQGISAEQMTFINTLINYLTINGTIDKAMLFDRPFTDINHEGILGVFKHDDALKIIAIVNKLNEQSNSA